MKRNLIAAVLAVPGLALAQAADSPFRFEGYGTAGLVHSGNRDADYLVDAFRPEGPGRSGAWSLDPDTRLGVQATATLGPEITGVVQVLAQQNHEDRYVPGLEWAYVQWRPAPELSFRAGRIVLPVFMATDTRLVGFANPWVRPPVEVYSMVPVTHNDGFDATWRAKLGEAGNTLQVTVGRSDSDFPNASGFDPGTAEARRIFGIFDTLEWGGLTLRASWGEARLTIPNYAPFGDALRAFGPPGAALADRYAVVDRRVTFAGAGIAYDAGRWFAQGEIARFDTRSILGAKEAAYVSAGWRQGPFTPYATYAKARAGSPTSDPGLPVALLPAAAQPTATALNALLNTQLNLIPRQETVSLGLRWDALRNVAVKVQYDRVKPEAGSNGTFGNVAPGIQAMKATDLVSLAVDFVF